MALHVCACACARAHARVRARMRSFFACVRACVRAYTNAHAYGACICACMQMWARVLRCVCVLACVRTSTVNANCMRTTRGRIHSSATLHLVWTVQSRVKCLESSESAKRQLPTWAVASQTTSSQQGPMNFMKCRTVPDPSPRQSCNMFGRAL